jgi:hypothetical protein
MCGIAWYGTVGSGLYAIWYAYLDLHSPPAVEAALVDGVRKSQGIEEPHRRKHAQLILEAHLQSCGPGHTAGGRERRSCDVEGGARLEMV